MKMFKVLGLSLTAVAAGVGSASLSAAEQLDFSPGFYVIATAGSTELDYGSSAIFSGNGYGIGVGYDFNNYLAVEAQYMNYFDMTIGTVAYKANGLTARALLRYPVGSWAPFIGLAYGTANESLTLDGSTYSSAGSDVGGTAGFEIALTDTIAFRVNADAYSANGVDQSVAQMGIVARF
jgi:hypothetical protein